MVDEPVDDDVEPTEAGKALVPKGTRKAFSRVQRALSDEDLKTPAVQQMLLDEVERLEEENHSLRDFQSKFHKASVELATLREKAKKPKTIEVLTAFSYIGGAALLAHAFTPTEDGGVPWILVAIGGTLLIGAVLAKAINHER